MSDDILVNKVAESSITEIDLEKYYPKGEVVVFDLKEYLFMGLILKEKDFRAALKSKDFSEIKTVKVHLFIFAIIRLEGEGINYISSQYDLITLREIEH